jgi:Amt family ammonium transporter
LAADAAVINAGDTAWMLTSSALVMLMIPGLALFYGGMVRARSLLSTMMHSMVALGVVGTTWVAVGYSIAFGDDVGGLGLFGWNPDYVLLSGVMPGDVVDGTGIPIYVHAVFQGMFAIITPALISGALAERIRFGPYVAFTALWSVLVYAPLCHQVWHPEGWLAVRGALDFAGGRDDVGAARVAPTRQAHGDRSCLRRGGGPRRHHTGGGLRLARFRHPHRRVDRS